LYLTGYQQAKVDETFVMYLMYLPPGEDSRWVPVGKWTWYWKGEATLSEGSWSLTGNDQGIGALSSDAEHTTWSEHYVGDWVADD
jgi:hypothetical protein